MGINNSNIGLRSLIFIRLITSNNYQECVRRGTVILFVITELIFEEVNESVRSRPAHQSTKRKSENSITV